MKNSETGQDLQGKEKTKKEQKVSVTYTLRAFGENIRKLGELGLITKEEVEQAKQIQENAGSKYVQTLW